MATTRGRLVQANEVVLDQADFFQSDGFTRVAGLTPAQLSSQLFFDNVLQAWPLVSGVNIPDGSIAAGHIYWHEVAGSPGIYSLRFRPNAVGYWRMLVTYTSGTQIMAQDYDVQGVQEPAGPGGGLTASFIKPNC